MSTDELVDRDDPSLEEILERVKTAMGAKTDAELARFLFAQPTTISTWKQRGTVPWKNLVRFAQEFDISLQWLLRGEGTQSARERALEEAAAKAAQPRLRNGLTPEYALIPFYDITVSGGFGAEVLDERPEKWNAWRSDYLSGRGLDPNALAEFSVQGDSMSPELNNRDTVLVDRRVREVRAEDIYVLRIENALVVKYVRREPDGAYILRSVNAASHPERRVQPWDYPEGHVAVIGRVVRQGRDR